MASIDLDKLNNPDIPPLPSVCLRLMDMLDKEDVSQKELSSLIKQDPSLTLKLLRAANSAFYALQTEVTNVGHAIALLGINEVIRITLTAIFSDQFFNVPQRVKELANRLWSHSVAVAFLSRDFDVEELEDPDLYTLGLLHDIGWLLIISNAPDLYVEIVDSKIAFLEDIEAGWGVDHNKLGARLSDMWELPEPFKLCALWHHDPMGMKEPPRYLSFICVANHLARKIGFSPFDYDIAEIQPDVLKAINLDEEAFKEMEEAAFEEKENIETLISHLTI